MCYALSHDTWIQPRRANLPGLNSCIIPTLRECINPIGLAWCIMNTTLTSYSPGLHLCIMTAKGHDRWVREPVSSRQRRTTKQGKISVIMYYRLLCKCPYRFCAWATSMKKWCDIIRKGEHSASKIARTDVVIRVKIATWINVFSKDFKVFCHEDLWWPIEDLNSEPQFEHFKVFSKFVLLIGHFHPCW